MEIINREFITNEFNKIRNYYFEESFYSAKIHISKKARNDWPHISSSLQASTPIFFPKTFHSETFHESGYKTEGTTTFHDVSIQKSDEDLTVIKQELSESKLKLMEKDKKIAELSKKINV